MKESIQIDKNIMNLPRELLLHIGHFSSRDVRIRLGVSPIFPFDAKRIQKFNHLYGSLLKKWHHEFVSEEIGNIHSVSLIQSFSNTIQLRSPEKPVETNPILHVEMCLLSLFTFIRIERQYYDTYYHLDPEYALRNQFIYIKK